MNQHALAVDPNYYLEHFLDHFHSAGEHTEIHKILEQSHFISRRIQAANRENKLIDDLLRFAADSALTQADYPHFYLYLLRTWSLSNIGRLIAHEAFLPILVRGSSETLIWKLLHQSSDRTASLRGLAWLAAHARETVIKNSCLEFLKAEVKSPDSSTTDLIAIAGRLGPFFKPLRQECPLHFGTADFVQVLSACLAGYQRLGAPFDDYFWETAHEIWTMNRTLLELPAWIRNTKAWELAEMKAMIRVIPKENPDYWPCLCAGLSRISLQSDQPALELWQDYYQETPWNEALLEHIADFIAWYPQTLEELKSKLNLELSCALDAYLEGRGAIQDKPQAQRLAELQAIEHSGTRLRLLFAYVYRFQQELEPAVVVAILAEATPTFRQICYDVDAQTLVYYLTLSEKFLQLKTAQEEWVILCSLWTMDETKLEQMVLKLSSEPLLRWVIEQTHLLASRVAVTDRAGFDLQSQLLGHALFSLCRISCSATPLENNLTLLDKANAAHLRERVALMLLEQGAEDQACRAAGPISSTEWEIRLLCYRLRETVDFSTIYAAAQDLSPFEDEWRFLEFLAHSPLEALTQLKHNMGGIKRRVTWINAVLTLGIYHLSEQEPRVWDEELRIQLAQLDPIELVPEEEDLAAYVLPRQAFFLALVQPTLAENEFDRVFTEIFSRPRIEQESLLHTTIAYLYRFAEWQRKNGEKTIKPQKWVRRLVRLSRRVEPKDGERYQPAEVSRFFEHAWAGLEGDQRMEPLNAQAQGSALEQLKLELENLVKGSSQAIHPRDWILMDAFRVKVRNLLGQEPETYQQLSQHCLSLLQSTPSALQRALLVWQNLVFTCSSGASTFPDTLSVYSEQLRKASTLPGQKGRRDRDVLPEEPANDPLRRIKTLSNWNTTRYDILSRAWPDDKTFSRPVFGAMTFLYFFLEPSYAVMQGKPSWVLQVISFHHLPTWVLVLLPCILAILNFTTTWLVYHVRQRADRSIKPRWIPLFLLLSILPYRPFILFYTFVREKDSLFFKACPTSAHRVTLQAFSMKSIRHFQGISLYCFHAFAPTLLLWPSMSWVWQHPEKQIYFNSSSWVFLFQSTLVFLFITYLKSKWSGFSPTQKIVGCLGVFLCCMPRLWLVVLGAVIVVWTDSVAKTGMARVKEQYQRAGRNLNWVNMGRLVSEYRRNNLFGAFKLFWINAENATQKKTLFQKEIALTLSNKLVLLFAESLCLGYLLLQLDILWWLVVQTTLLILAGVGLVKALHDMKRPNHYPNRNPFFEDIYWGDCLLRVVFWACLGNVGSILALKPDAIIYMTLLIVLFGFSMLFTVLPYLVRSGKGDALLLILVGALLFFYGYTGVNPDQFEPALLGLVLGLLWQAGFIGRHHWFQPFTWATLPGGIGSRALWVLTLLPFGGIWLPMWAYLHQGPWLKEKEVLYRRVQLARG